MKNSRIVALYGIIVALIICAYTIDRLISQQFGISWAVATCIVLMSVIQLFDFKTAVFSSTMFGVVSLIYSYIFPTLTSPVFQNPLVSIVPRVMIGIVSYSVFKAMQKACADKSDFVKEYVTRGVAAASGVITNTALVLTGLAIFSNPDAFTNFIKLIVLIFFFIELFCGLFVVPIVSKTVKQRLKDRIKL